MTKAEAEASALRMTAEGSAGISFYPKERAPGEWVVMGSDFGPESPWVAAEGSGEEIGSVTA
ncbi:hypothetical protein GCM10011380_09040 [Sphingomonas metalli]|uniref:Uncharacterized protein n=1 Tax=Sphingomonas metalli TaxID=1779358 RepID=A0A916SZL1_9SPHN|nr:hypothetical protein GCM10011380_09040 [Sphingomonas metalli]